MLKLIYSLSEKEFTLKFNKRKTLWSRPFVAALGISLLLHLFFLCLFKVRPTKTYLDLQLIPSKVIAISQPKQLVSSNSSVDSLGFLQAGIQKPARVGYMPKIEDRLIEEVNFVSKPDFPLDSISTFFSDSSSLPSENPPFLSAKKKCRPVRFFCSRELAAKLRIPQMETKSFIISDTQTLVFQFDVEFDNRSGSLFSSKLTEGCGFAKYDQFAEKIIHKLKIKPNKETFSTVGTVTLYVEANKRGLK